jgi:hypothetical protein
VQLTSLHGAARILPILALALIAWPAHGDGEIQLRTVYYKEKATRVIQPVVDMKVQATEELGLDAHLLVDSITSASVASGAGNEAFTENRLEGGAGLEYRLGDYIVGAFGRYSSEPDYKSLFGGVRAAAELAQKNTTLGVALSLGSDQVSNAGARDEGMLPAMLIEGELRTLMSSLSLTQLLSPLVTVGLTYDISYLSGFQENPYRPVFGAGTITRERVPDTRVRHALFGTIRSYLPGIDSTLVTSYRFYLDDWDVLAHTPEIRLIQALARDVNLHLRFRHYRQTGAYFYKPLYHTLDPALEPYVSEDVKLSAFTASTYGVRLELSLARLGVQGKAGDLRLDIMLAYVVQNNRYGNAVEGQLGVAIPLFD